MKNVYYKNNDGISVESAIVNDRISEKGCLVRTFMKKAWKASWSSGVNQVASDGEFHR